MKSILCLALIGCLAVVVLSDSCSRIEDCTGSRAHTHCAGDGWRLACISGVCTCTIPSSSACGTDLDCENRDAKCPGTLRWKCLGSSYRTCHCRHV